MRVTFSSNSARVKSTQKKLATPGKEQRTEFQRSGGGLETPSGEHTSREKARAEAPWGPTACTIVHDLQFLEYFPPKRYIYFSFPGQPTREQEN